MSCGGRCTLIMRGGWMTEGEREKWETELVRGDKQRDSYSGDRWLGGPIYQRVGAKKSVILLHLWNNVRTKGSHLNQFTVQVSSECKGQTDEKTFIVRKRETRKDKQKVMNWDNSPTVPQEKRVVPLLIVWSSHWGGQENGKYKIKQ